MRKNGSVKGNINREKDIYIDINEIYIFRVEMKR